MKLKGTTVLVTAGPTYEPIDPVRFIGNHSTGRMGFALAHALADSGARVLLVAGPVNLDIDHTNIQRMDVQSAGEMFDECMKHFPSCDGAILSAAVADFTPVHVSGQKIKKGGKSSMSIDLKPTRDILKTLGEIRRKEQFLIGFSLETNNELANARKKLQDKKCDMIVLNSLKDDGAGFGSTTNKVTILDKSGRVTTFQVRPKAEVAMDIIRHLQSYDTNED